MNEYVSHDRFVITGRGEAFVVDTRDADRDISVGDEVLIDGTQYRVRGIEIEREMTHPPKTKPHVVLLVTRCG